MHLNIKLTITLDFIFYFHKMSDYQDTKQDYKDVKRRYKEEKREAKQEAKEAKQEAKEERKEEKRNNKIEKKNDKIERKIERIEDKIDGLKGRDPEVREHHRHHHTHHEHHTHREERRVEPTPAQTTQPVKHYYAYRQIQPVSHEAQPVQYFTVSETTTTEQPDQIPVNHTPILSVTSTSAVFTSNDDNDTDFQYEEDMPEKIVVPLNFASNDDASPAFEPQNEPGRVAESEPEPGSPVPESEPKY